MSEYGKLTVVKLKELLKERGLPVTGKKADLIERLEENDTQQQPEGGDDAVADNPDTESANAPADVTPQGEVAAEASALTTEKSDAPMAEVNAPAQAHQDVAVEDDALDVKASAEAESNNDAHVLQNAQVEDSMDVDPTEPAARVTAEAEPENIVPQESEQAPIEPEKNAEGLPATKQNDQLMPAPEMTASQMPQPSIETQPTQENGRSRQPTESDITADPSTRSPTISKVNTQELIEDSRKRKRRSHSPPVSSEEVALKKAKAVDGSPRATVVQDGEEILPVKEVSPMDETHDGASSKQQQQQQPETLATDNRFKNLLPAREIPTQKMETQTANDQSTSPSRHSPTKVLYISNLMRPLQPNALRAHLEQLASPTSEDSKEEIDLFFLESTRRYCLAGFSSIPAASRARSNLHDRVWPDESNRKALFVDYVSSDLAEELIAMEESNATKSRLDRKKFEILYIDSDGSVTAEIHDMDSPTAIKHRNSGQNRHSVSDTKRKPSIQLQASLPLPKREESGKNFKQLDELFSSTTAKPRLYYLSVSADIAQKRLEMLSRATQRGDSRLDSYGPDDKQRYTFVDETIVDNGPEFGFGSRAGERGGRGGRGRGGSYRGRGRGAGSAGEFRSDFRSDYRGRSGAGIGYQGERW